MRANIKTPERRQQLAKGQFYTPDSVCDFMLSLALATGEERILEPGCGAGAFLLRAASRLQSFFLRSPKQIQEQLTGIELDREAIAQAQQSWHKTGLPQPEILHVDFLSDAIDDLGIFDVIIGNPPYVRQELLGQSPIFNKKEAHLYLQKKYDAFLSGYPELRPLLSQKADLYIWFFLQSATLLKPGGTLAFIISNSWLTTGFGKPFRQFLLQWFDLHFLIESDCEKWFPEAAVHAVIVLLKKKVTPCKEQSLPVRIVRIRQPLASLLPNPTEPDYWRQLQAQTSTFESGHTVSDSLTIRKSPAALFLEKPSTQTNITPLGWACIMRAPHNFLELREQTALWVPLSSFGEVRYPLKSGINRFFYMTHSQIDRFGIEPRFLWPLVKSIRTLKHYRVSEAQCRTFLFSCLETEAELQAQKLWGAYEYIQWGTRQTSPLRQKRSQMVPWPQVISVQNRRPWYAIKPLAPPDILCSRFYDRRFFFPQCQGKLMEDQTCYGLTVNQCPPEFVAGLLNSTLTWSVLEFSGRSSLGEGVLQFSRGDMATLPLPNPALYTPMEQKAIAECFQQMAQRPVYTVEDEWALADRIALDQAVLEPLLRQAQWHEGWESLREKLVTSVLARMGERAKMATQTKKKAPFDAC